MKPYQKILKDKAVFFAFVAPAILLIIIAAEYPFLMSLYYSFTKWNGISKNISFIGFRNSKASWRRQAVH